MNNDLFNELNGEDENKEDDLFNDINTEEKTEDDLFNDINTEDNDNIDDSIDDELDNTNDDSNEEDSVDTSVLGFRKLQLSRKTLLFAFLGVSLVIMAIVGLISFIVIHNDKPPVAQIVHIESNYPGDKTVAKYGNMVTLSFTFNEQIKNTPKVIINGKEVKVMGSGREFTANYFVIEQDYKEIFVEFSIEDYKDSFGKSGEKITNTTDLSKVRILAINA